jgi:hypothetical protein
MRVAPLVLFVAVGCASPATKPGSASGTRTDSRGSANLITTEQIANAQAGSAYEVISRVQPSMLRQRRARAGLADEAAVVVYVDAVRYGSVDALKSIPASSIEEIRYLSPIEATARYGQGHNGGVILVVINK